MLLTRDCQAFDNLSQSLGSPLLAKEKKRQERKKEREKERKKD